MYGRASATEGHAASEDHRPTTSAIKPLFLTQSADIPQATSKRCGATLERFKFCFWKNNKRMIIMATSDHTKAEKPAAPRNMLSMMKRRKINCSRMTSVTLSKSLTMKNNEYSERICTNSRLTVVFGAVTGLPGNNGKQLTVIPIWCDFPLFPHD
jgi:hypothetical protein